MYHLIGEFDKYIQDIAEPARMLMYALPQRPQQRPQFRVGGENSGRAGGGRGVWLYLGDDLVPHFDPVKKALAA